MPEREKDAVPASLDIAAQEQSLKALLESLGNRGSYLSGNLRPPSIPEDMKDIFGLTVDGHPEVKRVPVRNFDQPRVIPVILFG